MIEYRNVPFEMLSLDVNPRPVESIAAEDTEEMATTILQHGIIHAPSAREVDGALKIYIGQGRYLGFKRAIERAAEGEKPADGVDLSTMPIRIVNVDDRAMRELQWIENLQRHGVHPRVEARGYAELRDVHGYTLREISAKLGKGQDYVTHRLALLSVPESLWTAFDAGTVGVSHLEVVGTVPNPAAREEFAKMVLSGGEYGTGVLTVRQAEELKAKQFAASLRGCGFDRADAKLVAEEYKDGVRVMGGACVGCEHMTGSKHSPVCQNVACFDRKQAETWRLMKANAEINGRRVMDVDQTHVIFHDEDRDYQIRESCLYIDMATTPGYMETGHYDRKALPEWSVLLEGTEGPARSVIARHWKTKKLHTILERATAIELAEAKLREAAGEGFKSPFANRPGAPKGVVVDDLTDVDDGGGEDDDDGDAVIHGDGGAVQGGRRLTHAQQTAVVRQRNVWLLEMVKQRATTVRSAEMGLALLKMMIGRVVTERMVDDEVVAEICECSLAELNDAEMGTDSIWEVVSGGRIEAELVSNSSGWVRWLAVFVSMLDIKTVYSPDGVGLVELLSALKIDAGGLDEKAEGKLFPAPAVKTAAKGKKAQTGSAKVAEFVTEVMTLPVERASMNDHGVFAKDDFVTARLEIGKCFAEVMVAQALDGRWSVGYGYGGKPETVGSGGGWPNDERLFVSRRAAVLAGLELLIGAMVWRWQHGITAADACVEGLKSAQVLVDLCDEEVTYVAPESPEAAQDAGKGEISAEVKAEARRLFDEGLGKVRIAKQLGLSVNTVSNWQKRDWPKRGA